MKKIIFWLLIFSTTFVYAHEQWCLTPEQFQILKNTASPTLFIQLSILNITILSGAILAIILLGICFKKQKQLFPQLNNALIGFDDYGLLAVRLGLATTLLIAAFGLIPRLGFPVFTPTYFMPDLQLRLLPSHWECLKPLQIILAIALILGITTRILGFLIITATCLGFYLFGEAMFAYTGFLIAMGIFLLIQGGGKFTFKLSIPIKIISTPEANEMAIFILRIFTALNFIYLSIVYKFIHPNLDIEILLINHAFTFFLPLDVFSFCMAVIELSCGVLLLLGIYVRLVAIFLLIVFILFALNVNENIFVHTFIYGILLALIFCSSKKSRNRKLFHY